MTVLIAKARDCKAGRVEKATSMTPSGCNVFMPAAFFGPTFSQHAKSLRYMPTCGSAIVILKGFGSCPWRCTPLLADRVAWPCALDVQVNFYCMREAEPETGSCRQDLVEKHP